jgi:hypothetical protein
MGTSLAGHVDPPFLLVFLGIVIAWSKNHVTCDKGHIFHGIFSWIVVPQKATTNILL